jgi:hypothetical protein
MVRVFQLTRCQIGSNIRLMVTSKFRWSAASGVHSSISNVGFELFNSERQTSIHSSNAFWIFCICGVRGIDNSITVGGDPLGGSSDVAISTWNLPVRMMFKWRTLATEEGFVGRDF